MRPIQGHHRSKIMGKAVAALDLLNKSLGIYVASGRLAVLHGFGCMATMTIATVRILFLKIYIHPGVRKSNVMGVGSAERITA